jgi:hypothetical protein
VAVKASVACKEGVATHSARRVLAGEASVETEEDLAVATLAVATLAVATHAVATPAAETEIPEAIANAR